MINEDFDPYELELLINLVEKHISNLESREPNTSDETVQGIGREGQRLNDLNMAKRILKKLKDAIDKDV